MSEEGRGAQLTRVQRRLERSKSVVLEHVEKGLMSTWTSHSSVSVFSGECGSIEDGEANEEMKAS